MYLIVDANILLGAVLGKSLSLLIEIASRDAILLVPARMMAEVRAITADPNRTPLAGAAARLAAVEAFVTVIEPVHYEALENRARERLTEVGQEDWPLLAAALAYDAPVWSNDKDLWGTGVAVWRTRNIQYWQTGQSNG